MTPTDTNPAVYRVTEWAYPNSTITLARVTVKYDEYLGLEVLRFKDKWTEAWVQVADDGRVALFRWNTDILPVEGEDEKP